MLRLIGIETKLGNFDLAINQLITLTNNNNATKNEKYSSYQKVYIIYNMLGQLVKSIDSAEKLSQFEPCWNVESINDAVALAHLYFKFGYDQKAKKVIEKSAKLFPNSASESMLGAFRNIIMASIDIENENYKKV